MALAMWQGEFKAGLQTSSKQLFSFLPILVIMMLLAGFINLALGWRF